MKTNCFCYVHKINAYTDNIEQKSVYNIEKHSITFANIASFVAPFEGEGHENTDNWFQNFGNTASVLWLSKLKKMLFSKRLLRGKTKLFNSCETEVYLFEKIKNIFFLRI